MNKRRNIAVLLIGCLTGLALPAPGAIHLKLGISADYFSVGDPLYQSLYGSGNVMFGASAAAELSRRIEARVEYSTFKDRGAMTVSREALSLTLRPFIVGVRLAPIGAGRFRIFVGAGLGTMSIHETYPERLSAYAGKSDVWLLEGGIFLRITNHAHLVAGARYMHAKADVPGLAETLDLGGVRPGLGLTYTF